MIDPIVDFMPVQAEWLKQSPLARTVPAGEIIYRQGAHPESFYMVVEGEVEMARVVEDGERLVCRRGRGEVFGKICLLLLDSYVRPAQARAVVETVVLRIPINPIALMTSCPDEDSIGMLLEALASLRRQLARELREPAPEEVRELTRGLRKRLDGFQILEAIRRHLIGESLLGRVAVRRMAPGAWLWPRDQPATSFCYLHSGTLEAVGEGASERIESPMAIGESGYFMGVTRSEGLHVAEAAELNMFDLEPFAHLRQANPTGAIKLIYAAIQMLVLTIVERRG